MLSCAAAVPALDALCERRVAMAQVQRLQVIQAWTDVHGSLLHTAGFYCTLPTNMGRGFPPTLQVP